MNRNLLDAMLIGLICFLAGEVFYVSMKRRWSALSYRALNQRCRAIVDACNAAWPELKELRGEVFMDAMERRTHAAAALEMTVRSCLDGQGTQAVRIAAAKCAELQRVEAVLDEFGMAKPDTWPAERVRTICRRLQATMALKAAETPRG